MSISDIKFITKRKRKKEIFSLDLGTWLFVTIKATCIMQVKPLGKK